MAQGNEYTGVRTRRIIFADIDGTLVGPGGTISPRTLAAVEALHDRGDLLVLCTGRSRQAARKVADAIRSAEYGIVLNGAVALSWKSGEIIYRALLSREIAVQAWEIAEQHAMSCVWLGTEENSDLQFAQEGSSLWPQYAERNAARLAYVSGPACIMEPAASLAAYGTEKQTTRLVLAWQQELSGAATAVAGPTAAYGCWYAQLTAANATKARAGSCIADHVGVARARTVAIGDHLNDVDLLKWAGVGICMGDGHPDARRVADYVTGDFEADGAAAALERIAHNLL